MPRHRNGTAARHKKAPDPAAAGPGAQKGRGGNGPAAPELAEPDQAVGRPAGVVGAAHEADVLAVEPGLQ